jgi:hypothetical protein
MTIDLGRNLAIPVSEPQAVDTAKIIIRTYGLGAVQTAFYKGNMPEPLPKSPIYAEQRAPVSGNAVIPTYQENGEDVFRFSDQKDFIGKAIFSNLIIKARNYIDIDGNEITMDVSDTAITPDDLVMNVVLFDVSQQKNIVRTPIQGKNGEVPEYIADGDYAINIKGVFLAQNGKYPMAQMLRYMKLMKASVELKVVSWYLNEVWGINEIYITYFTNPNDVGSQSSEQFEIQAYSSTPTILKIRKRSA